MSSIQISDREMLRILRDRTKAGPEVVITHEIQQPHSQWGNASAKLKGP